MNDDALATPPPPVTIEELIARATPETRAAAEDAYWRAYHAAGGVGPAGMGWTAMLAVLRGGTLSWMM